MGKMGRKERKERRRKRKRERRRRKIVAPPLINILGKAQPVPVRNNLTNGPGPNDMHIQVCSL